MFFRSKLDRFKRDNVARLVALELPAGYSCFDDGYGFEASADWPQTGVFDAYKGYYTVALPQTGVAAPTTAPTGGAFLTLNMTSAAAVRNGTVRFAGVLPDGTSVSGSTAISSIAEIPGYDCFAEVPIFSRTAKNVLGAALTIDAHGAEKWDSDEGFRDASGNEWLKREIVRGAEDAEAYVLHRETTLSYETRHEVYGSYYVRGNSPEILDSFYEATAGYDPGSPFLLTFDVSNAAGSERYGNVGELPELSVRAGLKTFTLDRTPGFAFNFNAGTGVFRGTARIKFDGGRTAVGSFNGVLAPGWVLPCDCGIAAPEMPIGCGALYFMDVAGGRAIKRSVPIWLDKEK